MSPPQTDPSHPEERPSWVRDGDPNADATIEENWLFRLRRERFRSRQTGRSHAFYVIHLADAVNVITLTPDEDLVMVRQFRAGSGRDSLEPPGGLLEPGEDPCVAGARELIEETGYTGDPAVLLGSAWSNPSILSSRIFFVVVANARRAGSPKLDEMEEVTVELVPARTIPRMIRNGRIDHALSVAGLLWWMASRWPGPLARPAPRGRLTIGWVMIVIASLALILGLIPRVSGPSRTMTFVLILLAWFSLASSGFWQRLTRIWFSWGGTKQRPSLKP